MRQGRENLRVTTSKLFLTTITHIGPEYAGSTHASGACRPGSIPGGPTKMKDRTERRRGESRGKMRNRGSRRPDKNHFPLPPLLFGYLPQLLLGSRADIAGAFRQSQRDKNFGSIFLLELNHSASRQDSIVGSLKTGRTGAATCNLGIRIFVKDLLH